MQALGYDPKRHHASCPGRAAGDPLANKVARIVFVLMTRGGQYDDRPVVA
jgi:hypothetical protein